jgi:8-oxo-dGTP diphosphatase
MLGAYGVTNLVSSSSSRCVGTLVPYSKARDLTIQRHDKLSEEEGADDPKGVAKLIRKIRDGALTNSQPTAVCVHRPVLPHVLEALEMSPATLVTGEFLVAHLTVNGTVHAVERHRPLD